MVCKPTVYNDDLYEDVTHPPSSDTFPGIGIVRIGRGKQDDQICLGIAHSTGAPVVSNDRFRDHFLTEQVDLHGYRFELTHQASTTGKDALHVIVTSFTSYLKGMSSKSKAQQLERDNGNLRAEIEKLKAQLKATRVAPATSPSSKPQVSTKAGPQSLDDGEEKTEPTTRRRSPSTRNQSKSNSQTWRKAPSKVVVSNSHQSAPEVNGTYMPNGEYSNYVRYKHEDSDIWILGHPSGWYIQTQPEMVNMKVTPLTIYYAQQSHKKGGPKRKAPKQLPAEGWWGKGKLKGGEAVVLTLFD